MSFWSRSGHAGAGARDRSAAIGALLVLTATSGSAMAAEYYFQPQLDVSSEVDSNRDLVSSGPTQTAVGYGARAGAAMGIATPTSDTTVLPRFNYENYPRLSEHTTEEIMDFSSFWHSQRSQFSAWGQVDHSSLYSSELASAAFNPLNPNLPTTPETGRISVNGTRTLLTLQPKYQYNLTPRLNLGVSGLYQSIDYSGAQNSYVSYRYYEGAASAGWSLSPRATLTLGVNASKEKAKNFYSVTDGRGVTLTFDYQWSRTFTGSLTVLAEHDKIYGGTPAQPTLELGGIASNGVGATYTTTWKGQISQLQLAVGSTFTPSGVGSKYRSDQAQGEYKYNLSARLLFITAAHYIRNVALASQFDSGNYNYIVADAGLRWSLTPTWYIGGNVEYLEIQSPVANTSAKNNMARISFGYQALPRQY